MDRTIDQGADHIRNDLSLSSSISCLHGVGPRLAQRLARLGLHTVYDLLLHIPIRYQDKTRCVPIGAVSAGQELLIQGEVLLTEIRFGRRRMLLSRISDGTGQITIRFFHFSRQQQQSLAKGRWFSFFGEVRATDTGAGRRPASFEIVHPEYRSIAPWQPQLDPNLTPVYPTTEGIGQATLRKLVTQALTLLANAGNMQTPPADAIMSEWLPHQVMQQLSLPSLSQAVATIHRPEPGTSSNDIALSTARRRLAFEELLVQQLSLRRLRDRARQYRAPGFAASRQLWPRLIKQLPFLLTAAQQRVIADIEQDLQRPTPMMRLVQGDVGSGKTIVAAHAVVHAVESGFQAAVMAPTELLAEQHFQLFSHWLEPLDIEVAWLSGKLKGAARRDVLNGIASASVSVVIGTHALFQKDIEFQRLGLVVIDEQHRFGVHQRHALREKGRQHNGYPHQLIMTATPIPRTLVMTAYADLDTSVIDELPPGRQPITTVIVPNGRRDKVLERVRVACREGQQAYWVCTLIEESEALQCQTALDTVAQLTELLPELTIGLVHGRMKSAEKEQLMASFKSRAIDLLVATTVIEVGVDVPNASLMIIENAERLGLAQLHQLRGRIGRGSSKSSCVLMYRAPLSERGRQRLAILRDSSDGFEIARRDLEMRGPGEVLGTRQAGLTQFRVADLLRDQDLIPQACRTAELMLRQHPEKIEPMVRRWMGKAGGYGVV